MLDFACSLGVGGTNLWLPPFMSSLYHKAPETTLSLWVKPGFPHVPTLTILEEPGLNLQPGKSDSHLFPGLGKHRR